MKPDIIVWCILCSAGAIWPDKEESVFTKTYFGYKQCFSFPGENYQFHGKTFFHRCGREATELHMFGTACKVGEDA